MKKDPMESLSNLEKILQDNRQDPMQSYKILQEFYGILTSSGKDRTVLKTRSFEILQDPTVPGDLEVNHKPISFEYNFILKPHTILCAPRACSYQPKHEPAALLRGGKWYRCLHSEAFPEKDLADSGVKIDN